MSSTGEQVWYHVDVNSAYLSWTAAYRVCILGEDLDLRGIPSVIGGSEADRHGIVLAKSGPAKRYGIRTGETLAEARCKCPGLVILPPDYSLYVSCSRALVELLRKYSPYVHQYSIDEAFCQVEGTRGLWGTHTALPVVLFFAGVFLPLTRLITLISALVLKPFGVDLADDDGNVTEEDIMSMVNEGHEQGVLEADETEMITNIFELGDKEAADIMTHRTNMTALDGSMSLKEAVDFILNEGVNTRYPVYGEDIDDIIGILHMRDAMTFSEQEENRDRLVMDIPGLLREANFIPETRNIDTLFKEMQSRKIHMEIVVDEYGQTAGLLTMEDILEEIVGNIMDEYDEEEDFIQAMEDGTFVMSGLTPLEDVMETLDIELPEEDSDTYDTLNGYLVSRLDRIPQEGENPQVEFGGWLFEVERAGNKMIESVRVVPVPEGGKAADSGKELVEEKYDAVNREYEGDVS